MKLSDPILICGYGSIGRRHYQNLRQLGCENIIFYRSGKSVLSENDLQGVIVEYNLEKALSHHPAAAIIANPTALHLPVALRAAAAGCHLFLEKPISHSLAGVDELTHVVNAQQRIVLVGFQFRFHPALRQIKTWLLQGRLGAIVSVQAHYGEYLPAWHPWEDYRTGYSAKHDLGGGVVLTLCHPLDYLRWLISEVTTVSARVGQRSGLDIDVEDTAQITLEFQNGAIGSVYLDYIQRPPAHWLTIIGQNGSISWDNSTGQAKIFDPSKNEWEIYDPGFGFDRNTLFIDEMKHFLNCMARNEPPIGSLSDGRRALELAVAIKQSSQEKRFIDVT